MKIFSLCTFTFILCASIVTAQTQTQVEVCENFPELSEPVCETIADAPLTELDLLDLGVVYSLAQVALPQPGGAPTPLRMSCGSRLTLQGPTGTVGCPTPGPAVVYTPVSCSVNANTFCNDKALLDANSASNPDAAACIAGIQASCRTAAGWGTCPSPTCGTCPLRPTLRCAASSSEPNIITFTPNSPRWTGAKTVIFGTGGAQCNITCTPPAGGAYNVNYTCQCNQACAPC